MALVLSVCLQIFADSHGPLPREAEKDIDRMVRCGDPRYGLSLLHCPDCNLHMAVPYWCKTRVCPSCVNRRAEVLAHSLAEKLPEVDYRHLVICPQGFGALTNEIQSRRLSWGGQIHGHPVVTSAAKPARNGAELAPTRHSPNPYTEPLPRTERH